MQKKVSLKELVKNTFLILWHLVIRFLSFLLVGWYLLENHFHFMTTAITRYINVYSQFLTSECLYYSLTEMNKFIDIYHKCNSILLLKQHHEKNVMMFSIAQSMKCLCLKRCWKSVFLFSVVIVLVWSEYIISKKFMNMKEQQYHSTWYLEIPKTQASVHISLIHIIYVLRNHSLFNN